MSRDQQYICAISGTSAAGTDDDDDGEGIPVGWATVTVAVRTANPKHQAMVVAKKAAIEAQLSNVKDEKEREKNRPLAELLADVNFAAYAQMTPPYLEDDETVYVSGEQLPKLRELLGMDDE